MTTGNACEGVVRQYLEALQGGFTTTPGTDSCAVLTPFSRPDGEMVELELKIQPNGRIRLSDMGNTLSYLYVNGLTVNRGLLETAKGLGRRFGVAMEHYELVVESEEVNRVGERLHALIQSVLAVTDLIQKRRPADRLRFEDEVEAFLIGHKVIYDSGYEVAGTKARHTVRFHVNSHSKTLIQPLTVASEGAAFSWAERWAYRFGDILSRDATWNCFAVLDDRRERGKYWTPRTSTPFRDLATVILWKDNERLSQVLV